MRLQRCKFGGILFNPLYKKALEELAGEMKQLGIAGTIRYNSEGGPDSIEVDCGTEIILWEITFGDDVAFTVVMPRLLHNVHLWPSVAGRHINFLQGVDTRTFKD